MSRLNFLIGGWALIGGELEQDTWKFDRIRDHTWYIFQFQTADEDEKSEIEANMDDLNFNLISRFADDISLLGWDAYHIKSLNHPDPSCNMFTVYFWL